MKTLSIIVILIAGIGYLFINFFNFDTEKQKFFPEATPRPTPDQRILFSKVCNGVSNYIRGVEFSIDDKVPEEIDLKDIAFYENGIRTSEFLNKNPELLKSLNEIFSGIRILRKKMLESILKLEKIESMKKNLTDTDDSFRRRVELRKYNLNNEINRDAQAILSQMKSIREKAENLSAIHGSLMIAESDPFVSALASSINGPAKRGYPPPLVAAPELGVLKTFYVQVESSDANGTIGVEMEYKPGRMSKLASVGGGSGHGGIIAVPGIKSIYFNGLKGVAKNQRINVLARSVKNNENIERWNFIRFVKK